jgi:hypothetical protein
LETTKLGTKKGLKTAKKVKKENIEGRCFRFKLVEVQLLTV